MRKWLILFLLLLPIVVLGQASYNIVTVPYSLNMNFFTGNGSTLFNATLTGPVLSSSLNGGSQGMEVIFNICQDATGNHAFPWPPNVQNPPPVIQNGNACTVAKFINTGALVWAFSGTNSLLNAAATTGTFTNLNTTSLTASGTVTMTGGPVTSTGDALFGSGRPWYDVMAPPFNAKNDNTTNDTAAIQLAITTACAATPPGGIIYFPRGAGYLTTNTSTSPFTVSCSNLHFLGQTWPNAITFSPPANINGPNLTAPMFINTGNPQGVVFENLGFLGNASSSGASAILKTGASIYTLVHNFFNGWGGPAYLDTGTGASFLTENYAQNCLMVRPASTDTGCFDMTGNDILARGNFVTTSVGLAAGNLGTGHTYAWAIRGGNGQFIHNFGEISQHGWLVTGQYHVFVGNRSQLNQGNGWHVTGNSNIFSSNKALNNSQNATGTADGFLCDGLCSSNMYANNLVDDNASGNGNHTRHAFTDSNSNGTTADAIGNKYSLNRFPCGANGTCSGVLYNMTGTSPYAIEHPHRVSGDRGDNNITVQCGIDADTQWFNTIFAASRTVTLSTTGAWNGCRFRIVRGTSAGPQTVILGGNCPTCGNINIGGFADIEFIAGAWQEVASGVFAGPAVANSIYVIDQFNRGAFAQATGPAGNIVMAGTGDTVYGTYRVTADQTITAGASLANIPGLSWTMPANTALNVAFHCEGSYNETTGATSMQFGIQDVTVAPTNIYAKKVAWTSISAASSDNTPTLTTTTATGIGAAFTPSAATTVFNFTLDGMIEHPSNASSSVINIMAQFTTNNGVIKRGSYCQVY